MQVRIWRGNRASRSAFRLRDWFRSEYRDDNAARVYRRRNFNPRDLTPSQLNSNVGFINWGDTNPPPLARWAIQLNWNAENVDTAVDKSKFYELANETNACRIAPWTTHPSVVMDWLNSGQHVIQRQYVSGSGGHGMSVLTDPYEFDSSARLWQLYVKKRHEYRVHVGLNSGDDYAVIDWAQKRVRRDAENVSYQIRNSHSGWIFARYEEGVTEPHQDVLTQAVAAVRMIGLDYGAVDVGFNERMGEATVYEVNTAPGLEGTTLNRVGNFFASVVSNLSTVN